MVEQFAADYGYLGIIVFLVLTGCGLPLPEELGVIAAGILSGAGTLHPGLAFLACMVGCLLGDSAMYAIGYYFGRGLLQKHPFLARVLHAEREKQIEEMIQRHGIKMFFVARFLVGLRGPIYIAAGTLRVPFRLFILTDLVCATVVVALFFGLSYVWSEEIREWFNLIRSAEKTLTVVLVVAAGVAIVYFWFKRKAWSTLEKSVEHPSEDPLAEASRLGDSERAAEP